MIVFAIDGGWDSYWNQYGQVQQLIKLPSRPAPGTEAARCMAVLCAPREHDAWGFGHGWKIQWSNMLIDVDFPQIDKTQKISAITLDTGKMISASATSSFHDCFAFYAGNWIGHTDADFGKRLWWWWWIKYQDSDFRDVNRVAWWGTEGDMVATAVAMAATVATAVATVAWVWAPCMVATEDRCMGLIPSEHQLWSSQRHDLHPLLQLGCTSILTYFEVSIQTHHDISIYFMSFVSSIAFMISNFFELTCWTWTLLGSRDDLKLYGRSNQRTSNFQQSGGAMDPATVAILVCPGSQDLEFLPQTPRVKSRYGDRQQESQFFVPKVPEQPQERPFSGWLIQLESFFFLLRIPKTIEWKKSARPTPGFWTARGSW